MRDSFGIVQAPGGAVAWSWRAGVGGRLEVRQLPSHFSPFFSQPYHDTVEERLGLSTNEGKNCEKWTRRGGLLGDSRTTGKGSALSFFCV